jgi:guanylate kinase
MHTHNVPRRAEREEVMGRFVLLSGPSCIGKGPLLKAAGRLYPSLIADLEKVVLYNDRKPRPGEVEGVDYHFRKQEEIERFPRNQYVVVEIREGNFQALRVQDIREACEDERIGFLEVFYKIGVEVKARMNDLVDVDIKTVFLSPLSLEEIEFLKNERRVHLPQFVVDVMRRKLLRRVQKQKDIPSAEDLKDVEKRAGTAYEEMKSAQQYDYILPNHDGEDSDNWDQFYYPIGDARRTLLNFVEILKGNEPTNGERWSNDLLL